MKLLYNNYNYYDGNLSVKCEDHEIVDVFLAIHNKITSINTDLFVKLVKFEKCVDIICEKEIDDSDFDIEILLYYLECNNLSKFIDNNPKIIYTYTNPIYKFKVCKELVDKINLFKDKNINSDVIRIFNIINAEYEKSTLPDITDKEGYDFIFQNNLTHLISKIDAELLTDNLKTYVKQKYLGFHDHDNLIISKLNTSKSNLYYIKRDMRIDYTNVIYILNNIKYFNKRNFYIFLDYIYRNSGDNIDEIVDLVKLKFAKYVLSNCDNGNIISNYKKKTESIM